MGYTIDAVQEALSVLMHVAQSPGLGVTELAKRSGNTKARTFRLLSTLEQNGFVWRGPDDTSYLLGQMALVLGLSAQEQVSLFRIAKKHLHDLGSHFNETVQIRVRHGLQSISIAKWDSTRGVRVHTELGSRRALHAGASSKLLLAFAPPDVQSEVLNRPLDRFAPQTIIQPIELLRELTQIKTDAYAVSHGEVVSDVLAVAVPVLDALGSVTAALSISVPSSRAPEDLTPYIEALRNTSRSVAQELGWRDGAGQAPGTPDFWPLAK